MAFQSLDTIIDFLSPVNTHALSDDEGFKETRLGNHIAVFENSFPDISNADLVLVGCSDTRGMGFHYGFTAAPDAIRKEFYALFHWHKEVMVADIGNIKPGATIQDSTAALKAVLTELLLQNKKVIILGGSHDIMMGQYAAYTSMEKIIEATSIDAFIDLNMDSLKPAEAFLLPMLTGEPNFIKQYNHIGFQSYFVHPTMLEAIDKLRFDCYRVGKVKESLEEMEPVIRNTNMLAFDISAIQHAHAPANRSSPNGFTGEEACTLMQYAGMSSALDTIGIYGYLPQQDTHNLTAKQISHMLWYVMDGIQKGKLEAAFGDTKNFNEYKLVFAEFETCFLESKKTGRWWMQLPDLKFIACSYKDYAIASNNDIPERWLRAVERG